MIIGFLGEKQSGKGTAAAALEDKGWQRVTFAQPLKEMLGVLGLTDEQLNGTLKEVPCDLLGGKTPRHAMQTLGTEWGRNFIDPFLWTRITCNRIQHLVDNVWNVVVDDVRFQNEANAIMEMGGYVVKIVRPMDRFDGHPSEDLNKTPYTHVVHNDAGVEEFVGKVYNIAEELEKEIWGDDGFRLQDWKGYPKG